MAHRQPKSLTAWELRVDVRVLAQQLRLVDLQAAGYYARASGELFRGHAAARAELHRMAQVADAHVVACERSRVNAGKAQRRQTR